MYRKNFYDEDTDDDSDKSSKHDEESDYDEYDLGASGSNFEILNDFDNLSISNNKKNKRTFINKKCFSENEMNKSVWDMIEEHTKEKITSYLEFHDNHEKYGPFEKGANYQSGIGRNDCNKKFNTSNSEGLSFCVDSKVKLNDCTHIDASHLIAIKFESDNEDEDLKQKLSKTNPLPSCYNNGPDKSLETFLFKLIKETKSSNDLNTLRKDYLKKLEKKNYPSEIENLFNDELEKIKFKNNRFYYE